MDRQIIPLLEWALGKVAVGGAELLIGVGVARWKAWPAVEKCFLKFSIIVDLSVLNVLNQKNFRLH